MKGRIEGDDIEALERTIPRLDHNAPHDLVFIVTLKTTAKLENHEKIVDRFEEELKLQFGSAVTIERVADAKNFTPYVP